MHLKLSCRKSWNPPKSTSNCPERTFFSASHKPRCPAILILPVSPIKISLLQITSDGLRLPPGTFSGYMVQHAITFPGHTISRAFSRRKRPGRSLLTTIVGEEASRAPFLDLSALLDAFRVPRRPSRRGGIQELRTAQTHERCAHKDCLSIVSTAESSHPTRGVFQFCGGHRKHWLRNIP